MGEEVIMKLSLSKALSQVYEDILKREVDGDDGGFSDVFLCNQCFKEKVRCRLILTLPGQGNKILILCKSCLKDLINKEGKEIVGS